MKWRIYTPIVTVAVCYLTGAAVDWSWNPGTWPLDHRETVFILAGVFVLIEQGILNIYWAAVGDSDPKGTGVTSSSLTDFSDE